MKLHEGSLTVLGIALVHLYWGSVLLVSPGPLHSTPLSGLGRFGHHTSIGLVLIGVAVAAVVAMTQPPGRLSLACMMPQQMVLVGSTLAGIRASVLQRYADGTTVPNGWAHISTDQAPVMMLMLLHVAALLLYHQSLQSWLE